MVTGEVEKNSLESTWKTGIFVHVAQEHGEGKVWKEGNSGYKGMEVETEWVWEKMSSQVWLEYDCGRDETGEFDRSQLEDG